MSTPRFPVIDPIATGRNILSLRKEKGLSVRDLQAFFGFEEPQAIYRWQYGKTLPSVDNLYALSMILGVPMERILIPLPIPSFEQEQKRQDIPAASVLLCYFSIKKLSTSSRHKPEPHCLMLNLTCRLAQ